MMHPPPRNVQLVIAVTHPARRDEAGITNARRTVEGDVVFAGATL